MRSLPEIETHSSSAHSCDSKNQRLICAFDTGTAPNGRFHRSSAAACAGESTPEPTRFTFVRDGFYFWGFVLLGVVDAASPDSWLVAVLFVAICVLIRCRLRLVGVPPEAFQTG